MIRKIREARENEEGFTLIELLVVVIIIGILAAIAIPVFLNQREKAMRAAAESDARNAAIEVESAYTDALSYPATGTNLTAAPYNVETSNNVTLAYTLNAAGDIFCITAEHSETTPSPDAVYDSSTGGLNKPVAACSF